MGYRNIWSGIDLAKNQADQFPGNKGIPNTFEIKGDHRRAINNTPSAASQMMTGMATKMGGKFLNGLMAPAATGLATGAATGVAGVAGAAGAGLGGMFASLLSSKIQEDNKWLDHEGPGPEGPSVAAIRPESLTTTLASTSRPSNYSPLGGQLTEEQLRKMQQMQGGLV